MVPKEDRDTMRALAEQWMELAYDSVIAERKRLWPAVHF